VFDVGATVEASRKVKYPPSFSRRRQNEEEMLWPQTTPASTTASALVKSGSLEPTVRNSA